MEAENYEMTQGEIAIALNEWQRRFIEEPDRFNREWQTVVEYQGELAEGKTPSYGTECAAYLLSVHRDLNA